MADYVANGLRAVEKSLRDVILPSIDPLDPLAREQAALAIDYIVFVRDRIDRVPMQLRFELDHYRAMARAVINAAGTHDAAVELASTLESLSAVGKDPWTPLADLREAAGRLALEIDELVATFAMEAAARSAVDHAVLALTDQWIDFELSWYLPIAVDPDEVVGFIDDFFPYAAAEDRGR